MYEEVGDASLFHNGILKSSLVHDLKGGDIGYMPTTKQIVQAGHGLKLKITDYWMIQCIARQAAKNKA